MREGPRFGGRLRIVSKQLDITLLIELELGGPPLNFTCGPDVITLHLFKYEKHEAIFIHILSRICVRNGISGDTRTLGD